DNWIKKISRELKGRSLLNKNRFKKNMWQIASEFADIPVRREEKVKVGIVGEIYMKYSPLGNNNLEAFLQQEDVEIEIPGLMDFVIYTCDNTATDTKLYGMKKGVSIITRIVKNYLANMKNI